MFCVLMCYCCSVIWNLCGCWVSTCINWSLIARWWNVTTRLLRQQVVYLIFLFSVCVFCFVLLYLFWLCKWHLCCYISAYRGTIIELFDYFLLTRPFEKYTKLWVQTPAILTVVLVVSPSLFWQIPLWCLKVGHDRFPLHRLHLIFTNHSSFWHHIFIYTAVVVE